MTFTYEVSDGQLTDTATVTINVTAMTLTARDDDYYLDDVIVQSGPPNGPYSYSLQNGGPLNVPAMGVLANDNGPLGAPLTVTQIGSGPTYASYFDLRSDGSFTYTPLPNWMVVSRHLDEQGDVMPFDTFEYQLDDNNPATPPVTAKVTIFPPRVYTVGDTDDANVVGLGGLGFVGGGDGTAMTGLWQWLAERANGGDILVLAASGSPTFYPDLLMQQTPQPNSVTSVVISDRNMADQPWLGDLASHAEAIFIAGGDQARYIREWDGTRLGNVLESLNTSTVALAGSSAGMAILGSTDYTGVYGSVTSSQALADPYNQYMSDLDSSFISDVSAITDELLSNLVF